MLEGVVMKAIVECRGAVIRVIVSPAELGTLNVDGSTPLACGFNDVGVNRIAMLELAQTGDSPHQQADA